MAETADILVCGAGHNALVAATLLARSGLDVLVVEERDVVGGAARTETPFARAPELGASTGAYLLGLMPPELQKLLGVDMPIVRRDPNYFLPTTGDRYLLLGSDAGAAREQMRRFCSERDVRANEALQAELAALREDIAPSWLEEPVSLEETAERHVRPALRQVFVDLCRGSIRDYLDRFGFESDLVKAMYAVTDAFTGLDGSWDTPGSGLNFLVHNMGRLPGSDGAWMIVRGGMGTVTARLADAARRAGARIETGAGVQRITTGGGAATGAVLTDGREIRARAVLAGCDPFRMRDLVGRDALPADYNRRIDGYLRDGTSLKVNLALDRLPTFACLPDDRGQHKCTVHLLPEEDDVVGALERAYASARAGALPERPAIEWYFHTTVDPTLRDREGRHSAALFVQWVPYDIDGSSWDAEESRYVDHLLSICDRFAPDTSRCVADAFALPPPKIERHFGITRGHIHHVDNSFGFTDRVPYATPIEGLYACSAGCHPAGSVIGAAGHNAARRALKDLGRDG